MIRLFYLLVASGVLATAGVAKTPEIMVRARVATPDSLDQNLNAASTIVTCAKMVSARYTHNNLTIAPSEASRRMYTDFATCGKRFDPRTLSPADLQQATTVYRLGGLDAYLFAVLDRRISSARTDSARIAAIVNAIGDLTWHGGRGFQPARMARAEAYLAQLDTTPAASLATRVRARIEVLTGYERHDPRVVAHMTQIDGLLSSLSSDARRNPANANLFDVVYGMRARRAALIGDYPMAVAWMDSAFAAVPRDTKSGFSNTQSEAARSRYAMVGTKAPEIRATYWLNAPATTTQLVFDAPVTLIEFTSTGCGWCRVGYPTMRRLYTEYRARGLAVTFVSRTTGTLMGGQKVSQAEELAEDRRIWIEGDSIPFPIAIQHEKTDIGPYNAPAYNAYHVIGEPTYFIVDRRGVIRHTHSGHVDDLEAMFRTKIEQLLEEQGK